MMMSLIDSWCAYLKGLKLLIIKGGLKDITPNQVLGDVMTQETYRVEREGDDKEVKKEEEEKHSIQG